MIHGSGRPVFQDINPGEIIALERPLVGVAQCDYEEESGSSVSKACHNCLAYLRLGIVYPSPIVKGVYFCTYREADTWRSLLR